MLTKILPLNHSTIKQSTSESNSVPGTLTTSEDSLVISKQINFIALLLTSVTRKKSPNVYKSCPKMVSLEK